MIRVSRRMPRLFHVYAISLHLFDFRFDIYFASIAAMMLRLMPLITPRRRAMLLRSFYACYAAMPP